VSKERGPLQVTIKNPETGKFETQQIEKEGPAGFITTTTSARIHSENETRNVSIFPDQSEEQTMRIYEAIENPYLGQLKPGESELIPWQNAQLILEQLPVYIPFAPSVKKYFPKNILRTRRDYGQFLAFVEVSAFLHQKQRPRVEINDIAYIRATLADYHIASTIVGDSLSKSIYELPPKTIELIEIARELQRELGGSWDFDDEPDKNKFGSFTITALAKKIRWDRDTVTKWMKPATIKGYFTITSESKGSKGAEYIVENKDLPGKSFLPSVEQLLRDNPNEPTEGIYDPITGEILQIKQICTDAPTRQKRKKFTHMRH
jgi:hypothetical protein